MLQQFSWATFLIFFALVSALWYLALLLTVYRKDLNAIISGHLKTAAKVPVSGAKVAEDRGEAVEDEIIGKSKLPEGLEVVSIATLNFSAGNTSSPAAEKVKSDQLGLVPDVLQELKEIFGILAKEDGTKQDFFSLAAMISEKYGRIGSNPNIGKINEFIRDNAPFAVSLQELENLWD